MDYGRMIVEAEAWGSACDYSPPPAVRLSLAAGIALRFIGFPC